MGFRRHGVDVALLLPLSFAKFSDRTGSPRSRLGNAETHSTGAQRRNILRKAAAPRKITRRRVAHARACGASTGQEAYRTNALLVSFGHG